MPLTKAGAAAVPRGVVALEGDRPVPYLRA